MTADVTQAIKNRNDALSVVAMGAFSLFISIGGYVINQHGERLDAKDTRITALEIKFSAIAEHVAFQDRENQNTRSELAERISRIETKPTARPDPFTGTQGKKLEEMINELRRQLYSPKHNTKEEQ